MATASLPTLADAIRSRAPLYYRGSRVAAWGPVSQVGPCPCGCTGFVAYITGEQYEGLARHVRACHLRTPSDVILTACEQDGCGCRERVGTTPKALTLAELAKAMQDEQ